MFIIFLATEDLFTFVPGSVLKNYYTIQCPLHVNTLAGSATANHSTKEVTHRANPMVHTWDYSKDFCYSYGYPLIKLGLYGNVYGCAYCLT